jgi:hypothetical protein
MANEEAQAMTSKDDKVEKKPTQIKIEEKK